MKHRRKRRRPVSREEEPRQPEKKPRNDPKDLRGLLCIFAALAVFLVSAAQLCGYFADYLTQRRENAALSRVYREEVSAPPVQESETPAPEITPVPPSPIPAASPEEPEPSPAAQVSSEPAFRGTALLKAREYPDNPQLKVSPAFTKLKKANRDIVGWLTIPDLVDEAVVLRDNSYYLDRDYRGYHSQEGALFLDENTDLKTRPYTLIIFGHNMKSGSKFGYLKRYENSAWAKQHLTLSFSQQYEDGNYVVFAACSIYTGDEASSDTVHLYDLYSKNPDIREMVIEKLTLLSCFDSPYTAKPDDQLLMLVTCVGTETQRFVVAARRVRPEETVQPPEAN